MFGLRDKEGSVVFHILLRTSVQRETCGKKIYHYQNLFLSSLALTWVGRYWVKFLQLFYLHSQAMIRSEHCFCLWLKCEFLLYFGEVHIGLLVFDLRINNPLLYLQLN